jgi:hypothetical protein
MTPQKKMSLIAIATLPLLAILWFTGHGQDSIFSFHLAMLILASSLSALKNATFPLPGLSRPVHLEWIPIALLLIDVPVALVLIAANVTIQLPWSNAVLAFAIIPIALYCFFFGGRLTSETRGS